MLQRAANHTLAKQHQPVHRVAVEADIPRVAVEADLPRVAVEADILRVAVEADILRVAVEADIPRVAELLTISHDVSRKLDQTSQIFRCPPLNPQSVRKVPGQASGARIVTLLARACGHTLHRHRPDPGGDQ